MNKIKEYIEKTFEDIKYIDKNGNEYWLARELMKILEYRKWENFHKVIRQAMFSCESSNYNVLDHFPEVGKMVKTGDSYRKIDDYKLLRYACYLIA